MDVETVTRKPKKGRLWIIIGICIVLIFAIAAGFFFWQWQSLKSSPSAESKETASRIIEKVGNIYELPANEEPTVALIQDKQKLSQQAFFDKAQNGDYLIVYSKAKLAMVYREQTGKLVSVGPVSIDDKQNQ